MKTIAKFLYGGYISIFGAPTRLLSDRGSGFTISIIEELCKILGIQWLQTMPYHPQINGLVERSYQMIMHIIEKLGEDKKANWPSHLAEIVHAYNATWSTVTGYSPHYLMFGRWPRLLVDSVFPTIGSNEPPWERPLLGVWMWMQLLWEIDWGVSCRRHRPNQPWKACWQKWYYNRKIGAVKLKPGDLVLVKMDAWKGKRKIKDRWEEETSEVVHQIAADIPSYKVMNQHDGHESSTETSFFSSCQRLAFPCGMATIIQRTGVPTIPWKTTSFRDDEKRMSQEKNGKVVTWWSTSKASLGWKNGKLWLIPWTSTGASTEDRWRPQVKWFGFRPWKEHVCKAEGQCLYPLMLVDSEPEEECYHSPNRVTAGKAKQKWGSEMAK